MDDIRKGTCPKCRHHEVLAVAEVPDASAADEHRHTPMRVASVANPERGWLEPWLIAVGHLSAYVCRRCGYTELDTLEPEKIPVDGERTHLIIGPTPEGPYR